MRQVMNLEKLYANCVAKVNSPLVKELKVFPSEKARALTGSTCESSSELQGGRHLRRFERVESCSQNVYRDSLRRSLALDCGV